MGWGGWGAAGEASGECGPLEALLSLVTLVGQRGHALAHLSQAFESRLCNWRRPSPTGLRRQRTRLGAHGGAGPLGPEAPAAGLPQPALRPLADRVAGRGGQQGAPHTIRISKGGSRPGLMGQELAEPDAQARPDPVPSPCPPGAALAPALPAPPAQRQRSEDPAAFRGRAVPDAGPAAAAAPVFGR